MKTIFAYPANKDQLAVLKAMKIPFEIQKSTYDPEFIKMIKQG